MKTFFANGCRKLAYDIALWTHLRCAPIRKAAVVHWESIVMLSYRNHIFGASFAEQFRPSIGIKFFSFEERDEIFVAELRLRAVCLYMILERIGSFHVHVARVPFAIKRRNRIDAPMNKNAKLRVLVPSGNLVLLDRFPRGLIGPVSVSFCNRINRILDLLSVASFIPLA